MFCTNEFTNKVISGSVAPGCICPKVLWLTRMNKTIVYVLLACTFSAATLSILGMEIYHRKITRVPCISVEKEFFDLGNGSPGEELDGQILIKNLGGKDLEYEVAASCGCTSLNPRKGVLRIGQSQVIDMSLKLPDHSNSEKSVRVIIQSNDPDRERVTCIVKAHCPAPFVVAPSHLTYGALTRSQLHGAVQDIEITPSGDGNLEIINQVDVKYCPAFLKLEKRQESSGDKLIFNAFIRSPLEPGDYFDTIVFSNDGGNKEMKVPVSVKIVEPISFVPSTIHLRKKHDSERELWVSSTVILSCREGMIPRGRVQLTGSDIAQHIVIQELSEAPENRRLFRIVLQNNQLTAKTHSLQLDIQGCENKIPIHLIVHR